MGYRQLLAALYCVVAAAGCRGLGSSRIDLGAVRGARAGLDSPRIHLEEDERPEREPRGAGSVILGELLAIFPGILVQGVGHYYAGDYNTAARLFRVGETGYLLTAVGAGVGIGGYYLDRGNSSQGLAYSLYASGGLLVTIGVGYWLTAWFYDMIDTPRAVRSGGEPPPKSKFVEALDIFN